MEETTFVETGTNQFLYEVEVILTNGQKVTTKATGKHRLVRSKAGKRSFITVEEMINLFAQDSEYQIFLAGVDKFSGANRVINIKTLGTVEKVYCCKVSTGRFALSNGLVSGNCGEIPLYAGEPCDLGAMNLAAYVLPSYEFDYTGFEEDVKLAIRFLDNVLDVNQFALEDNRKMSQAYRRLGLGIMGLADALIRLGLPFNSEEAREEVESIIDSMRCAAIEASEELAKEKGAFPAYHSDLVVTPRRNVALLTVAPTGTTAMIMGVSGGVEPVFAPFIHRKVGSEYMKIVAPLFKELMEEHTPINGYRAYDTHKDVIEHKYVWDWDKLIGEIQSNHGSVQGLPCVPNRIQQIFLCAHDIAPKDHIAMQGVVQRAFDARESSMEDGELSHSNCVGNSISKTINLPNSATVNDVLKAYHQAWVELCKGVTVYRDGSRDLQVLNTSIQSEDFSKPKEIPNYGDDFVYAVGSVDPNAEVPKIEKFTIGDNENPLVLNIEPKKSEPLPDKTRDSLIKEASKELSQDRPTRLQGFTDRVKLTDTEGEKHGFWVTVNHDGNNNLVEVFIISGKGGNESNADSEALGRLVSISLQNGVPVQQIVDTLRGINGGMYGTYHKKAVTSKADLIAIALSSAQGILSKHDYSASQCPDCKGNLSFSEGCTQCVQCGYSKCG